MNGTEHAIKAMEIWRDACHSGAQIALTQTERFRQDAILAAIGILDTENVMRRVLLPGTAFARAYEQAAAAARKR